MKVETKLAEMHLELPNAPALVANYVRTVRAANLLFVSGHGPQRDGKMEYLGKVGKDLSVEEGYKAAQLVCLNCLASVKSELGDLDRVKRVVKLLGMVDRDGA